MQRMASFRLKFLEQCHKDGKFLYKIVQGDEIWISFVSVETKKQARQWMHTHIHQANKKFTQTSACQKADGTCFLGQKSSADSKINASTDHNNVRNVL
jgi:hypothetical protein